MNKIFAVSSVVIMELYRRKDFYVLFILTALITLLLGSVNVFGNARVLRYLQEVCLLLIWISALVIALATTARQIPSERENRTIFPLLAKPVTRGQLIFGKFLGCWLACGLALLVFYIFFALVGGLRAGSWPVLSYFQAAWLHWWMLGIVIAMTLLGSLVLAAPSSTITIVFLISTGLLFLGRHLHQVALRMSEPLQTLLTLIYFMTPHLEFFDLRDLMIHQWGLIAWPVIGLATLYAAAYTLFFLLAAWLVFRNQPLQR